MQSKGQVIIHFADDRVRRVRFNTIGVFTTRDLFNLIQNSDGFSDIPLKKISVRFSLNPDE